jgi:ATP-dependent RNA helicase DeaD
MSSKFSDMGLSQPILKALDEMGFEEPTEVQERAIPHILKGNDVIVMSKTGSGKTAVFGVSVLEMINPADKGPQCLILAPTRELAVQVDNDLKKMAKYLEHRTTAVYGQHNMNTEIQALKNNVSIVTGTPGRVYDHIQNRTLITKNIRYLVLDEVDRMMDMGFIDQVRRIIRTLPGNRTTLLFSATIPDEIRRLCSEYMRDPVTIEIESETMTVDAIEQRYYRVERNEKRTQLNRLLLMERPKTCMIFCNTRRAVDQVLSLLHLKGYACRSLHGDIPQNKRMKNIQQFKRGGYNILVATDVAARGIHIDDLSLVINYDVPMELDSYVHRIGRTGRAGHEGRAISLVTSDDIMTLYAIEEHINSLIPEAELPTDEDLAQHKEEIDKWKQDNAVKTQPYSSSTKSGSKSNRKKSSRKKPAHQRSSQQRTERGHSNQSASSGQRGSSRQSYNQQKGRDTQLGPSQEAKARQDYRTTKEKHRFSSTDRISAAANQNYSERSSRRSDEVRTAAANTVPADKKIEPQETAAKKSIFKRIMGRLFKK